MLPRIPALVLALATLAPLGARAQDAPPPPPRLRVFLDCQTFGCDQQFIRSELTWVDWVADRQTADVHLLVTSQNAGGGGNRFNLDLLGVSPFFAGQEQHLTYSSSGNATDDEVREGLLDRMGLGLVPFAVRTTEGDRLGVTVREIDDEAVADPRDDPWNFWVFTVGLDGNLEGESRQREFQLEGSAEAERVTELWRIRSEMEVSRTEDEFELNSGTRTAVTENWSFNNFVVRGIADHWALGVRADMGRDTRFNQDYFATFAPGIEFSVFPYTDFSRRALTVQYLFGAHHFRWTDTTVYGHTRETRLNQSLNASLDLVQPWGEVDVGVTGSHYFHKLSPIESPDGGPPSERRIPWRVDLGGRLEVRLFRGFFVNFGGNYRWIRDQLHIPKNDIEDEDILLELQQLATDFSYDTFFGISYRFGSIFSGAVNPRFGGGNGGGGNDDFE